LEILSALNRELERRLRLFRDQAYFIRQRHGIKIDNRGDPALFADAQEVLRQAVAHVYHRTGQTPLGDSPAERDGRLGLQMRAQGRLRRTAFALVYPLAVQ